MNKPRNWTNDPKVKEWNKTRQRTYIKASCFIIVGAIMYLIGWGMIGLPQFLIALGAPLCIFGGYAFYGQAVSEIPIDAQSRNNSARKN